MMDLKIIISIIKSYKDLIVRYLNNTYSNQKYISSLKQQIIDETERIVKLETMKDLEIVESIIDLYEVISNNNREESNEILQDSKLINNLDNFIKEESKKCYGTLRIDHEHYNLKTILCYENDNRGNDIAYMAGSFYTDQEYRTFLATIQKGKSRITYQTVESKYEDMYDLRTIKDGYISRVKKAINGNTQDGYHADFVLDSGRFFLLREEDNPVDIVYNWITKNTQAAVLPEWKTYLYNSLNEYGHIKKCKSVNYSNYELEGIVLAEEVDTEMIRKIRKEGLDLGQICIPREPVDLDPSMSFIDAMTSFIIPHITQKEHLYNIGDALSPIIESPIIFKKGNTIKKTYLFPRQKVMAQGMLNGIKEGRNSIILNGGMGVGKTYISIKTAYATIKEHMKKDSARISVFCQSHLLNKWERQFKEALPDVLLSFIKINGYKDVVALEDKKPEGIEVYLLPKDKVKRKYLEEFGATNKFKLSSKFYNEYNKIKENDDTQENIFIVNTIKPSEMKVLAFRLQKIFKRWICVAKEVFNDEGNVIGYKVASSSKLLKEKLGNSKLYYDFYVDSLNEIYKYKEELDSDTVIISNKYYMSKLICPCCGGPIYDNEEKQLSEDDKNDFLYLKPSTKTEKNKKCNNYIKVDGTPLTEKERSLLIKGELDYLIDSNIKTPYIDSDDSPITDYETIQKIKQGNHNERYTIVLKHCSNPLWTVQDRKGYRTVNAIDMLKRRFGKSFFDFSISDESHLYSSTSSQGSAFSKLCRMSKVNLALTGTLTGGKSSHMFYTLYRMIPHKMSKHYKYNELSKFIGHYGRRKKVTKEYKGDDKYNKSGQGKITSSGFSEIPGISPMLYSHFLADIMVSRKIEDMGFEMPELKFYKNDIPMSEEVSRGYDKLKRDIITFMKANKHLNLGGTYLNALLSYPDMPLTEPLMYENEVISNPEPIDIENIILPKEQKLIDTIKSELYQNRRCLVYITYTGTKEVDKRVETVLSKAGIKVAVLKSSVNTEKREQWIEDRYKEGVQCILTNPKLVQTGLDIITYPTLIFFQLDYDVRVVRQAESRAWRVGQENTCKVIYMYYQDTMQYEALKLIGSKKKASLALEGVFAEDVLSSSGEETGDSGAAALYKSLLGTVKLKEDDLDFFSEEEIIEIIDEIPIETNKVGINTEENLQISFFTITEDLLKKSTAKVKKNLTVGQVSMFEF